MPITYIIIGITVLTSFSAFNKSDVLHRFMMNPYQIQKRGQYYRFLTSGFIHGDHMHLLMNMLSLYFFGTAVERVFAGLFDEMGGIYFVVLYLVAICVSDWPTYFKHRNNPAYNSLGASGGVAAIIFAFIIFRPLDKIYLYFAIGIPGFILGTLYLIYSYFQGRKANDNINHDAHLFGALFGLVFCIVVHPSCIPEFLEQISHWKFFQ
ncbi:MAG TPA: rhomboid family intramembrane serine protease [Ignavibacteriaceae bacterium]